MGNGLPLQAISHALVVTARDCDYPKKVLAVSNETTVKADIYWVLLIVSAVLLVLIPDQAAWVETKRGWYTQPMMGALLGLGIMTIFSAYRVLQLTRNNANQWRSTVFRQNPLETLVAILDSYRTALISSILFFLYIKSLSIIGFVLATFIFVTVLLWLSRLFNRTWLLATIGTLIALVLIFRVAVSVWLPDVWLYSLLPDHLADFANRYL